MLRFCFLNPSDPYRAYYEHKINEIKSGKGKDSFFFLPICLFYQLLITLYGLRILHMLIYSLYFFFNLKNPKQKKTMNFYPAAPEGEEEKPSTPAKVQVKPVAPVKPPPKEPPSFEFSVDLPSISAQDL